MEKKRTNLLEVSINGANQVYTLGLLNLETLKINNNNVDCVYCDSFFKNFNKILLFDRKKNKTYEIIDNAFEIIHYENKIIEDFKDVNFSQLLYNNFKMKEKDKKIQLLVRNKTIKKKIKEVTDFSKADDIFTLKQNDSIKLYVDIDLLNLRLVNIGRTYINRKASSYIIIYEVNMLNGEQFYIKIRYDFDVDIFIENLEIKHHSCLFEIADLISQKKEIISEISNNGAVFEETTSLISNHVFLNSEKTDNIIKLTDLINDLNLQITEKQKERLLIEQDMVKVVELKEKEFFKENVFNYSDDVNYSK